jgi:itaconyl-CoA hydratase
MSEYGYVRLGANRYRERFGLSFEDLHAGMRILHRPGIDVSQQDNQDDATDLLNNAQLHYDSHYAAQTEWQRPLGVSTLTVQRLFGMASRSWYRRRNILSIDSIAMTRPVFGGDTLYATSTVNSLDAGSDADVGQVGCTIEGVNQRDEVVSRIAVRMEVYRRLCHPEDEKEAEPAEEQRFCLYHTRPDGALVEQTGLWFEDLVPGETFVHWPGRTLDFADSRLHALRSLDINPRWSDVAYLRTYPTIQPAIFEPLVIGAVTALTTRTLGRVVANLGWSAIELPRPVQPGETVYAQSTIQSVRGSQSRPTQGIAQVETRGFVASGELVCRYQRTLLIYRRNAGPYAMAGY